MNDSAKTLTQRLQMMIGQPLLKATVSYPNEVCLHFGQALPYSHPRMKGDTKGEYIISTRASNILLVTEDMTMESIDVSAEKFTEEVTKLSGRYIERMTASPSFPIYGFGLSIILDDRSVLVVIPSKEGAVIDEAVVDWSILAPANLCLEAGPGLKWDCHSSDVPMNEINEDNMVTFSTFEFGGSLGGPNLKWQLEHPKFNVISEEVYTDSKSAFSFASDVATRMGLRIRINVAKTPPGWYRVMMHGGLESEPMPSIAFVQDPDGGGHLPENRTGTNSMFDEIGEK